MGTLYHWVGGKIEFHDKANEIYAYYTIGGVKGKTQEYFDGKIVYKGEDVSKISGNYCGYIDIDDKRYFDIRQVDTVYHPFKEVGDNSL